MDLHSHPDLLTLKRTLAVAVAKLAVTTWDTQPAQEKARIGKPAFIGSVRSAVQRRAAKKQSSTTTTTTSTPAYNPFARGDESPANLPLPPTTNMNEDFMASGLDLEINADTFDWMFWDQLMKDPNMSIPAPS